MHVTRWRFLKGKSATTFIRYALVLVLCLSVAGCKKDPKVTFIQGTWYYHDAHLANIPGESGQETYWVFDNGYFSLDSCCFVKSYYSGYYSITERTDNGLTLELYNLRGQYGDIVLHRGDTLAAMVKIDTQADTLTINSDGPYTRVSP